MVATVSNCCCCCSLKTGTIVIGILGIISCLLSLVQNILVVSGVAPENDPPEEEEIDPELERIMEKANFVIAIITFITVIFELVLSILLVIGACKEKPRLITPWIYYSIVCLIIADIAIVILIILSFVFINITAGIVILIPAILISLLSVYLIIVVNSFHRQLLGVDLPVMAAKV